MMSSSKAIEITYISDKVKQSPIITIEENMSIVDSQSELIDIKKSIIGILDCTNIETKIKENQEGRHIYKLKEDISKHILGTISNNYSKEEKKEIIKEELKKITQNVSVVLIHSNNIFITDTGRKEKKIQSQSTTTNIEKRFNGYDGDEINELIFEYLGSDKSIKQLINKSISEIKYNQLHLNQIISILTLGYKQYLQNQISNTVKLQYDLESEIANAISGKILRDNFSYSKILLFDNIYNNLIDNKITNRDINSVLIENISEKYINLNKNNIFTNLNNLEKIYNTEINIYINNLLNKLFIFEGSVNELVIKVIKQKLSLKFGDKIKETIIHNLINKLIIIFKTNTAKLPNQTIDFLKAIGKTNKQIKVSYIKTPIDIVKLSSNLKILINEEIKSEKIIDKKNLDIEEYKKRLNPLSKSIKGIEIKYKSNNDEINTQLIKIGFKSLLNTNLITSSLLDESNNSFEKQKKLEIELKNMSSNKIKEALNSGKIKEIKIKINKLKSRIRSIDKILSLIKLNKTLLIEIDNYYNIIKMINSSNNIIKSSKDELLIVIKKITQIKKGLEVMLNNTIK